MIGLRKKALRRADPFDSLLGYHLRRLLVLAMADFVRSLAPLGLSPVSASVLFVVEANAGLTQSEVGKELGIVSANLTPLVAGLAQRGLLLREPRDGRSLALSLSPAGADVYRRSWKAAKSHEKSLFGSLSTAARARLILQLRTLWENIESSDVMGG